MESTSLFGNAGDAEEDKDHIIGDSNSPKRYGGLWHLATFIAVGISCTAFVSNLWALTEWQEIKDMYKGDEYEGTVPYIRDMFLHVMGGLCCILAVGVEIEFLPMLRQVDFMSNFLGRGIFYYFLSTLTYDAATSGDYARQGFNSFITFCLMGLACLYIGAAVVLDLSPTLLKGLISMQGISTGNDYDL